MNSALTEIARSGAGVLTGDVEFHALVYWRLLANDYLSSENSAMIVHVEPYTSAHALYIRPCPSPLTGPQFSAPPYYCASYYLHPGCSVAGVIARVYTTALAPGLLID